MITSDAYDLYNQLETMISSEIEVLFHEFN